MTCDTLAKPVRAAVAEDLEAHLKSLCAMGPRCTQGSLWRALGYLAILMPPGLPQRLQRVPTKTGSRTETRFNLITSLGDQDAETVIVVGAHYDTVASTEGADDNASGALALTEIAWALQDSKPRAGIRIDFVHFVNEEPPHFSSGNMGSAVYFDEEPKVAKMFNLDCVGYPVGQGFAYLLHTENDPIKDLFSSRSDLFQSVHGDEHLVYLSDLRWAVGKMIPAVHVNDMAISYNHRIHTPMDTPDTLSYTYMADIVLAMTDLLHKEFCT